MSSDINLYRFKKTGGFSQGNRKLMTFRALALVVLFGISVSAMILFILISLSPLPALKKQEDESLQTMSLLHNDIAKEIILNERMDTITAIVAKRRHFDKIMQAVQSLLPSGLTISSMLVDGKSASFTIRGTSLSLIDSFLNNLVNSPQSGKAFSRISLSSLVIQDQNNAFSLTVALTYL